MDNSAILESIKCLYAVRRSPLSQRKLGDDLPRSRIFCIYYEKRLDKHFLEFWLDFPDITQHVKLSSYGELDMLTIPSALQARFQQWLRNKEIPKGKHGLYKKWFRYYLDFCQKYDFPEARRESLPAFLRKLEKKKQTKGQRQQGADAITLYYEIHDWKGLSEKFPPHLKTSPKSDAPSTGAKPLSKDSSQKQPEPSGALRNADRCPSVRQITQAHTDSAAGEALREPLGARYQSHRAKGIRGAS